MDDPVAALEALTKLRERNLVSEEEFATKRADILARLDGARPPVAPAAPNLASPASPPAIAAQALSIAPVAIVVGGALYALGSALPWLSATAAFVGTITRSGLEGLDGVITLIIGIAIALVGVGKLIGSKAAGSKFAVILLSVIALGIAGWELSIVNDTISGFDNDLGVASVGIGLWMMVVGGIVAALGALTLRR